MAENCIDEKNWKIVSVNVSTEIKRINHYMGTEEARENYFRQQVLTRKCPKCGIVREDLGELGTVYLTYTTEKLCDKCSIV